MISIRATKSETEGMPFAEQIRCRNQIEEDFACLPEDEGRRVISFVRMRWYQGIVRFGGRCELAMNCSELAFGDIGDSALRIDILQIGE